MVCGWRTTGTLLLAPDSNYALAALYPGWHTPELTVSRRAQLEASALKAATDVQSFGLLGLVDDDEKFDPDEESEGTLTALFADRRKPAPAEAMMSPLRSPRTQTPSGASSLSKA